MAYGDYYTDTPLNRAILAHLGYMTTPAHTGVVDDVTPFAGYLKQLVADAFSKSISGNVDDEASAVTDFDTNLTEESDDHYNGCFLVFTEGVLAGQGHILDDYVGGSKNCSFLAGDQWTEAPATDDGFIIIPGAGIFWKMIFDRIGAPAGASIAADIAYLLSAVGGLLTGIQADTDEVQQSLADGGDVDLLIDGIVTKLAKPAADAVTDATIAEVVGIKGDAAQTTVGTTRSLMGYLKGVLNQVAILIGYHTVPAKDATTDAQMRDVIGKKDDTEVIAVGTQKSIAAYVKGAISLLIHATYGLSAIQTLLASTGIVVGSRTTAASRLAGVKQVFTKLVQQDANMGLYTIATCTTAPVLCHLVIVRGNSAQPAHMTAAGIWAGIGLKTLVLNPDYVCKGNLDAYGEVDSLGLAMLYAYSVAGVISVNFYLAVGEAIAIDLQGTGSDHVDLKVIVEYEAVTDGGYLA